MENGDCLKAAAAAEALESDHFDDMIAALSLFSTADMLLLVIP